MGLQVKYDKEQKTNRSVFQQGTAIHQITTGTSGKDLYPLCPDQKSEGNWVYSQNKYYGFSQVHADAQHLKIVLKGVEWQTK